MPNTTRKNPDADFSGRQFTNRVTGVRERPSKTQGVSFGGTFYPTNVPEQIDYRFKKKRLGGKRAAARGRSALAIRLDSEKPAPRF
jgi:hypothetical protein